MAISSKKSYWIALAFILIGITCFVFGYALDTLFLIGWLSLLIGILFGSFAISSAKRAYWIALACVIIGIVVLTSFALLGSTIDEQGIVHEQFGLLPIGWFFIFIGLTISIIKLLLSYLQKFRAKP